MVACKNYKVVLRCMENIKVVHIEAVLMNNGEVIHFGKSLGFVSFDQMDLVKKGATKLSRGGEIVVALKDLQDPQRTA